MRVHNYQEKMDLQFFRSTVRLCLLLIIPFLININIAFADNIYLELECGSIGSNWSIQSDDSASNGEYVIAPSGNFTSSAPTNSDDWITLTFNVSTAGSYTAYTRFQGPNGSDDSYWIRTNGGSWIRHNTSGGSWEWGDVVDGNSGGASVTFSLVAGTNTIDIGVREDGTPIDKLFLTLTGGMPSGEGGAAVNCGGGSSGPCLSGNDNDGDGIDSSIDLDDDNDGILDTDECTTCDTDGDGCPNHQDPDSDNDGCPDAWEGGKYQRNDLTPELGFIGSVDANGVPNLVNGGQGIGTSQNPARQSPMCLDPCNAASPSFSDNDYDGVGDFCDRDADNDGILDEDELDCVNYVLHYWNLGIAEGAPLNGQDLQTELTGITAAHSVTGNFTSFNKFGYDIEISADPGVDEANPVVVSIDFSQPLKGLEFDINGLDGGNTPEYVRVTGYYQGNALGHGLTRNGSTIEFLPNGYAQGLGWGDQTGSLTFYQLAYEMGYVDRIEVEYHIGGTINAESNTIILAWGNGCALSDYDGDGTPNHLDLDSDNDNCPDVIEGYYSHDGHYDADLNWVSTPGDIAWSDVQNDTLIGGVGSSWGIPYRVDYAGEAGGQEVGASQDPTIRDGCEDCYNSIDDDGDGDIDCDDTDCSCGDVCSGRVFNGLVAYYDFTEGSGNIVNDKSGYGTPINLTILNPGNTTWETGCGLTINSDTRIESTGAATKINNAIISSNALTIEAWVHPPNNTQGGRSRLVTLSEDGYNRNASLYQHFDEYAARNRTTTTNDNGEPTGETPDESLHPTGPQHVVYTWDGSTGQEYIYIDGEIQYSGTRSGNTSNWDTSYRLALGSELNGDSPWRGTFYQVAIYDEALSTAEVLQNLDQGHCCANTAAEPFVGCDEDRRVDIYVEGIQNSVPATVNIPNSGNVDSVRVEIIYDDNNPGSSITIQGSNGVNYTANRFEFASDDYRYTAHIPTGVSSVSYSDQDNEWWAQSMVVFAYRSGLATHRWAWSLPLTSGYSAKFMWSNYPYQRAASPVIFKSRFPCQK